MNDMIDFDIVWVKTKDDRDVIAEVIALQDKYVAMNKRIRLEQEMKVLLSKLHELRLQIKELKLKETL